MAGPLRPSVIGLTTLLAFGCLQPAVDGSGKVISEPRNVSGFSRVSLSGDAELVIEQTGSESLTVTADDNLLPYLTSEVQGGELRLRSTRRLQPSAKIVYRLTAKTLDAIDSAGDVSVKATQIATSRLSASLAGSGDITLAGKADTLALSITGDGKYEGAELTTREASISTTGSARAVVAVSDTLSVNVVGDGSVEYIGNPTVTRNVVGSGSIRQR